MRDALGAVQSVLVLGGTSDIAAATLRRLVAGRCRTVVLAARDPDGCTALADELRGAGATVESVTFDARDTDAHPKLIAEIYERFGDLDLVLVAFGVLGDQERFDADPRAAAEAVQANYVGAVTAGLAVGDQIRRRGHGTIVALSSVAGIRARKTNFVYGSSKAGFDAFYQGLGDALVPDGGRVLVVRPGFVHSRMTEGMAAQPFATTPEAVADAIVVGLQRNREVVWVPNVLRWVFGVLRVLPRPLWRIVSAR